MYFFCYRVQDDKCNENKYIDILAMHQKGTSTGKNKVIISASIRSNVK